MFCKKIKATVKSSIPLFFIFLCSAISYAESNRQDNFTLWNNFNISIIPQISYTNGTLQEILYYYKPSDKKISLLEWERKFFTFGAQINSSYKKLHLDFSFNTALKNSLSGQMRDSDFLNEKDYSMKTTYSVGNNYSKDFYNTDCSIYYDFNIAKAIKVSPVVQVQYNYDSFKRPTAQGWYSDGAHHWNDPSSTKYPYHNETTGKTYSLAEIDFYRHTFFTWSGFSFFIKPKDKISFNIAGLASPFAYFYSIDTHFAQDRATKKLYEKHSKMEQNSIFSYLKIELEMFIQLTKQVELKFGFDSLFNIKTDKGSLYTDHYLDTKQDGYIKLDQKTTSAEKNITATVGLKINVK